MLVRVQCPGLAGVSSMVRAAAPFLKKARVSALAFFYLTLERFVILF